MRRGLRAFSISAMVGFAGCAGSADSPAFVVTDSAGVQVVENHAPEWEAGEGWRVGPGPILRLGVVAGDPAFQFEGIAGMARLGDGTLVVADGGSQEVRFFEPSGSVRAVVGGPGEGPGEFTGLSGLGKGDDGLVWAYDFSLRRITWLNGSGEMEGLVSLGPEPPTLNSVGPLPGGGFLLKQLWGASAVSQATETGFRRDPVAFVRFDGEGTLLDTLGLFPGRELVLTDENGRGVMNTPPFGRNSVGSLWGRGVAVGTQSSFQVVQYAHDGTVLKVVRIPGWDLSLESGDVEAYIESRLAEVPPEERAGVRQGLEALPVPPSKPAFGGFVSDEAGHLWVGDWSPFPEVPGRWTILDSSGRWLGSVRVGDRFFPYAAGDDWVLGVEWDALDVEYVVMYPLLKVPGSG